MRRRAVLAALLVLPLLAMGAAASPQPVPVCVICGDRMDTLNNDRDLSVGHTTVTIEVATDGSADWRLTGELENLSSAAYYREHPDELEAAARAALTEPGNDRPAAESISNVNAWVDDEGRLVVRFTQTGFAERRAGGVLFSDYLFEDSTAWMQLAADRLVVEPPEFHRLTNAPAGAEGVPYRAAWGPNDFHGAYLVMAEDDGAATNLATRLVLARQAAPNVLVALGLALPGALLLVPLGAWMGQLAGREPVHPRGPDLVAGGGALVFVFGLAEPTWPLLALGGVGVVGGGLARSDWARARLTEPAHWAASIGLVLAVVGFAFSLVEPLWIRGPTAAFWRGIVLAGFALPAALLLPYGVALERGRGRRWLVLASASLLLVSLVFRDPTRPPGTFAGLFAVFGMVGAAASAALGLPLCWLGRQFVGPDAE